jgi:hypothetical protein
VKAPKTSNGVRRVPIEAALVPLLARMREGKWSGELVAPLLSECDAVTTDGRRATVDHLAVLFRDHLKAAGVERVELHESTRTHVQSNFRSWRDSGLTWLAMTALGVDKIMRRAGHDMVQTTMGYVKQAEDLTGDLGAPFAPLPDELVTGKQPEPSPNQDPPRPNDETPPPSKGSGGGLAFWSTRLNDSERPQSGRRDSNPRRPRWQEGEIAFPAVT